MKTFVIVSFHLDRIETIEVQSSSFVLIWSMWLVREQESSINVDLFEAMRYLLCCRGGCWLLVKAMCQSMGFQTVEEIERWLICPSPYSGMPVSLIVIDRNEFLICCSITKDSSMFTPLYFSKEKKKNIESPGNMKFENQPFFLSFF